MKTRYLRDTRYLDTLDTVVQRGLFEEVTLELRLLMIVSHMEI